MRSTCKVDDCDTPAKARELCGKHYQRGRKAGTLDLLPPRSEWERFWEKVEIGDCWVWQAGTTTGYGSFSQDGRVKKLAHRWAWETLVGPVPEGLDLDHLCRNRACVNPDHLEPVTRRENLLRGATLSAFAAFITHCPRGHEYTETNTYRNKRGHRFCRRCAADWSHAARERRKQQEVA